MWRKTCFLYFLNFLPISFIGRSQVLVLWERVKNSSLVILSTPPIILQTSIRLPAPGKTWQLLNPLCWTPPVNLILHAHTLLQLLRLLCLEGGKTPGNLSLLYHHSWKWSVWLFQLLSDTQRTNQCLPWVLTLPLAHVKNILRLFPLSSTQISCQDFTFTKK